MESHQKQKISIDDRLKNYIVQSHLDKPLTEQPSKSIYDYHIQAGTALTDQRICELNDMVRCPDNISERNLRYSEATAMYWVYKNLDSPYVGISHYRRRLNISDEQYGKYLDKKIDIITSIPIETSYSIEDYYRLYHYSADWDLFINILNEHDKELFDYAKECFGKKAFHPYNIHVFRSELYKEFCDVAFPVCDEFYKLSYPKTDIFQHRDVGFIMERLSHLFVVYKKMQGHNVIEAPIIKLSSTNWLPESECNLKDSREVYEACSRLYCKNHITRCNNVLGAAIESGTDLDSKLSVLFRLLNAALNEQSVLPQSMFEYLPIQLRENLDMLISVWSGFEKIIRIYMESDSDIYLSKLVEYIGLTGFSIVALRTAMEYIK